MAAAAAVAATLVVVASLHTGAPTADAVGPPLLDFEYGASDDIGHAVSTRSADLVLQELAQVAAHQEPEPAVGTTQRVTWDSWGIGEDVGEDHHEAAVVPLHAVTDLRADGSLRLVEYWGQPLDLRGRLLAESEAEWLNLEPYVSEEHPAGTLDASYVRNLPRDPAALRRQILADMEWSTVDAPDLEALIQVTLDLFGTYVVPPDLASAVWRMLADEPALRYLGAVTDRAGREGRAVSYLADPAVGYSIVLVISPETGRLLGWERIVAHPEAVYGPGPLVREFVSIDSARWIAEG